MVSSVAYCDGSRYESDAFLSPSSGNEPQRPKHLNDEFPERFGKAIEVGSARRDLRVALQTEKPTKTVIDFSGERRCDAPVPVPEGAWVGKPDSGQIDGAATGQIAG